MTKADVKRPYAPRMSPEDRREQLLDAVLQVVADIGVHKVSIESVAAVAGVTRPVVYKHFHDSSALLRASLEREKERAAAQCAAAVAQANPQSDSREYALAIYGNLLTMFQASPDLWRAILQVADSTTPEFRRTLEAGREQAVTLIVETLSAHADGDGASNEIDVELSARMLVAVLMESGRLVLSEPGTFTRERLVAGARGFLARR